MQKQSILIHVFSLELQIIVYIHVNWPCFEQWLPGLISMQNQYWLRNILYKVKHFLSVNSITFKVVFLVVAAAVILLRENRNILHKLDIGISSISFYTWLKVSKWRDLLANLLLNQCITNFVEKADLSSDEAMRINLLHNWKDL